MKSLPKIAAELSVPIATLRYRLQAFNEFITYSVNGKNGKEYSEDVECIIKEINSYCDQKKSTEEIISLLATKYARDIEIIEDTTETTTIQQHDSTELIRLNNNLEKMIERLDRQQELQQQINEMRLAISEISRVGRHKKNWFSWLWG
jgi:hypothetical protein